MVLVIDSISLTRSRSWQELARAAAEADFEHIELPFSPQASLTPETGHRECLDIRRLFYDAGVYITALRFDVNAHCHIAAPLYQTRHEAARLIGESLQRCRWLGAEVLSIPVFSPNGSYPRTGETDYGETLAQTRDTLSALIPGAEEHGVRLALEVPGNAFLNSPVEASELIDRVNSPWAGVRLDVDRALEAGLLPEWLGSLGWRLAALSLNDAGETIEAAERGRLAELLNYATFSGPVVVAGRTKAWWSTILESPDDRGGLHRRTH
jgi:sugar phosphate isomerase/epimerase